jgi:hypothetical protein
MMKKRFILLAVLMILVGALPASAGQIARSNGNISASTSKWALEAVGLGTTTLNNQSFYLIPTNSFRGKANASQFVYFNLNNTGTSTLSGFTMEATQGGAVSQQVQITFERCTTEWDQINDICSGSTSTLGAAATNPNVSVSGLNLPPVGTNPPLNSGIVYLRASVDSGKSRDFRILIKVNRSHIRAGTVTNS